jgi:Protein of unknown function (DUF3485)
MNKQKWIILITTLGLIGGGALLLTRLEGTQKLGQPAIKTSPIPGSQRLRIDLPERALDYTSEEVKPDKVTLDWLPQDTSLAQRVYKAPDGFQTSVSVVLMGSDRTSLHQTQFCMAGAGWNIDHAASRLTKVHMERPYPYDLPVMEYVTTRNVTIAGEHRVVRGIYVLWFVADDDEITAKVWQRMWWMARDLLHTGVLQRWAEVAYFSVCAPGQEDATFERMKKLMVASVPEFQLVPHPRETTSASAQ